MSGSGANPIGDRANCVDPSHAMTTALRYQQYDKAGRFGREVRTMPDDGHTAEPTTDTETGEWRVLAARYEVDAEAVAEAIIARLAAGGTLRLGPDDF